MNQSMKGWKNHNRCVVSILIIKKNTKRKLFKWKDRKFNKLNKLVTRALKII